MRPSWSSYNLMGPPSYMRSVVDRNVVMRHIPVVIVFPELEMKTEKKPSCRVEKHEPIPEIKKNNPTLFLRLDILTGTVFGRAKAVRRQFCL